MDANQHTLTQLFEQLGLSATPAAIDEFIARHGQLTNAVALDRAPFWNAAQRGFLTEGMVDDADWSCVVDQLNSRLHQARR